MNVIVVGSTGMCGSAFLRKAIESSAVGSVWSFSRSSPKVEDSPKLNKIMSSETGEWGSKFPEAADVMFSGIATTKATAGGLDKQKLIDIDLQVNLAKEAKAKGCKTFILISATMASTKSMFAYSRMKGEAEEAIIKLNFDKTIILRPGPLLGKREKKHNGAGSSFIESVLPSVHRSMFQSLASYPVYADEVAECGLKLAEKLPNGVHVVESKDILTETGRK